MSNHKYVLIDNQTMEFFATETEACTRFVQWKTEAENNERELLQGASRETIHRLANEERWVFENDDMSGQIRMYVIDLDDYNHVLGGRWDNVCTLECDGFKRLATYSCKLAMEAEEELKNSEPEC